ncbi:hypothetical protein [[Ruminococcus] torques]|uniref:hypothetical protein n=1 Tax=[Ruminococcus] torques TaxID=33039 RepID=UPI003AB3CAEB
MADNIDFALNDHFYDFVDDWNYKFYFLVGGYGSWMTCRHMTRIYTVWQGKGGSE